MKLGNGSSGSDLIPYEPGIWFVPAPVTLLATKPSVKRHSCSQDEDDADVRVLVVVGRVVAVVAVVAVASQHAVGAEQDVLAPVLQIVPVSALPLRSRRRLD